MNKQILYNFCIENVIKDEIVFDEILDVYDRIKLFLFEHNIKLKHHDENIFLMKLVKFIFDNSK